MVVDIFGIKIFPFALGIGKMWNLNGTVPNLWLKIMDVDRAIYELPDVLICVCRHCIWHMEETFLAMKKLAKKKHILICNLGGEKMEMEEKNCLYFPFDENIFLEGGEKERYMREFCNY